MSAAAAAVREHHHAIGLGRRAKNSLEKMRARAHFDEGVFSVGDFAGSHDLTSSTSSRLLTGLQFRCARSAKPRVGQCLQTYLGNVLLAAFANTKGPALDARLGGIHFVQEPLFVADERDGN